MRRTLLIVLLLSVLGISVHAERQSKFALNFKPAQSQDFMNVKVLVCAGSILEDAENRGMAGVIAWSLFNSAKSSSLAGLFDIFAIDRKVELTPNWLIIRFSCRKGDLKRLSSALAEALYSFRISDDDIANLPDALTGSLYPFSAMLSECFPSNALFSYPPETESLKKIHSKAYNGFASKYVTRKNTTVLYEMKKCDDEVEKTLEEAFEPAGKTPSLSIASYSPEVLLGSVADELKAQWYNSGWILPIRKDSGFSGLFVPLYLSSAFDVQNLSVFSLGAHSYCLITPPETMLNRPVELVFMHRGDLQSDYCATMALCELDAIARKRSATGSRISFSTGLELEILGYEKAPDPAALLDYLEKTSLNVRHFRITESFTPWDISSKIHVWFRKSNISQTQIIVTGQGFCGGSPLSSKQVSEISLGLSANGDSGMRAQPQLTVMPIELETAPLSSYPGSFAVKMISDSPNLGQIIRLLCDRIPGYCTSGSKSDAKGSWKDHLFSHLWKSSKELLEKAGSLESMDIFIQTTEDVVSISLPECEIDSTLAQLGVPESMVLTESISKNGTGTTGCMLYCSAPSTAPNEYPLIALHLYAMDLLTRHFPNKARREVSFNTINRGSITILGLEGQNCTTEGIEQSLREIWNRARECEISDMELVSLNNKFAKWLMEKNSHEPYHFFLSSLLFRSKTGPFANEPVPTIDRHQLKATAKYYFSEIPSVFTFQP